VVDPHTACDAEIFMAANLLFSSMNRLNAEEAVEQPISSSSNYKDYASSSSSSSEAPNSPIFQRIPKRSFRETLLSLAESSDEDDDDEDDDEGASDGDWGRHGRKTAGKPSSTPVKGRNSRKPVQRRKTYKSNGMDSPGSTATDGESGGISASSTAGTLVYGRVSGG
jgi:hypothetical protein